MSATVKNNFQEYDPRHRLTGAVVLILLAIILLPMLLSKDQDVPEPEVDPVVMEVTKEGKKVARGVARYIVMRMGISREVLPLLKAVYEFDPAFPWQAVTLYEKMVGTFNFSSSRSADFQPAKDVAAMPVSDLRRWFLKGSGQRDGLVKVRDQYMNMVQFGQLNLKHEWQHQEKFDMIFCRNVMIYFDNGLRAQLLEKFHSNLKPGGYLVLGHSESLFGLTNKFSVVGKTIHQKKAGT